MESLESNKFFAGILLAALIAMFAGFIAEVIFHVEPLEETAYAVDTSALEAASAGIAQGPDLIPPIGLMLASFDPAEGEGKAKPCMACHNFEKGGPNKVGPNLWNIVGAKHAHLDNFSYSTALTEFAGVWTYEELNAFLYKPKKYIAGTKMNYAGIKKEEDRAKLIAWLRSLSDAPQPLPDPATYQPTLPEGDVMLTTQVAENVAEESGEVPAAMSPADAHDAAEGEETVTPNADAIGIDMPMPENSAPAHGDAAPDHATHGNHHGPHGDHSENGHGKATQGEHHAPKTGGHGH